MITVRASVLVGLLTCGASFGCDAGRTGPDAAGMPSAQTRDSAGIRIVVTDPGAPPRPDVVEPSLVLGGSGEPAEVFHRITDAVLWNGRVAVANVGSGEIRVFDGDGRFVASAGRRGDGPGEYREISWVRPYRGDSLAVWDHNRRRLTILGADLETGRTVDFASSASELIAVDVFAGGDVLARFGEVRAGSGDTTAVRRDDVRYARLDPEGQPQADLIMLPDDEAFVWSNGPARSVQPLAFGRTTSVRTRGEALVFARNDAFQVAVTDSVGRIVHLSRLPQDRVAVTDEDRRGFRDKSAAGMPAPFREVAEKAVEAMPIPDLAPFHGKLLVTRHLVWLERYRKPDVSSPGAWVAFDSTGVATRTLVVPHDVVLTDIDGDEAIGIRANLLGVEEVVVLPIS